MSNICPCPNPPGGQIVCSDDQFAMCGFRNGTIISGCFDIPPVANLAAWAVFMMTGVSREVTSDDIHMLQSGRYINPSTGEVVTFRVPIGLHF